MSCGSPVRLVLLEAHDQHFDLGGQLVGMAVEPPGAVGEPFQTNLIGAGEDLVVSLAGDTELRTAPPSACRPIAWQRTSVVRSMGLHAFQGILHSPQNVSNATEGAYLPEIYRLRGACLLALDRGNKTEALSAFTTAADSAAELSLRCQSCPVASFAAFAHEYISHNYLLLRQLNCATIKTRATEGGTAASDIGGNDARQEGGRRQPRPHARWRQRAAAVRCVS